MTIGIPVGRLAPVILTNFSSIGEIAMNHGSTPARSVIPLIERCSLWVAKVMTFPVLPARAVRPERWR